MAESTPASKLWLPHEKESVSEPTSLSFPTEFPYEFDSFGSNSDLNSPVESVVSFTETESIDDDDDFFAGLTQQLAWSSLCVTEKSAIPCFNLNKIEKTCVKASSPQSTLSQIDTWIRLNSPTQFQSPPMALHGTEYDARNLLNAAAREVARLKLGSETTLYHTNSPSNRGLLSVRSSIPVKSTNNGDYALFSNQSCTRNPALAAQLQRAREELILQALCASSRAKQANRSLSSQQHQKPEIQNRGRNIGFGRNPTSLHQSGWIPPQSQHQNPQPQHIRSVPLGRSHVKRTASSGTGVFLPRRYVNVSECRQKPGNPTVRYPEEMRTSFQSPFNGCLAPAIDNMIAMRNPLLPIQSNLRTEMAKTHELHLPQEWTY